MRTITLSIACAVLAAVPAFADIIFDNGGPNTDLGGTISDAGQGSNAADSFVLGAGANTIRDVHWWGGYDPEQFGPDNFLLAVFEDDGGQPDSATPTFLTGAIFRSNTGLTNADGFDIFRYDTVLESDVVLTPNETYWLAILNFTDSWFWQHSNRDGEHIQAIADGGILLDLNHDLAFILTDAPIVPEPASMLIVGLGLAGLALRHKRHD